MCTNLTEDEATASTRQHSQVPEGRGRGDRWEKRGDIEDG